MRAGSDGVRVVIVDRDADIEAERAVGARNHGPWRHGHLIGEVRFLFVRRVPEGERRARAGARTAIAQIAADMDRRLLAETVVTRPLGRLGGHAHGEGDAEAAAQERQPKNEQYDEDAASVRNHDRSDFLGPLRALRGPRRAARRVRNLATTQHTREVANPVR